jgi:TolB-like protein
MNLKKYYEELKRRNVFKVAITYGITAWLLLQIVETVVPIINAPNWLLKVVLILLIIGLPIALIFSWAFEMSPKGIIRTESVDAKENPFSSKKKKPFTSLLLLGFLLLLVVGQFAYNKFWNNNEIDAKGLEIDNSHLDKSIAVLPLVNLNSKGEDLEYFSDGVTQEIIYELVKVKKFAVTAFTTSFKYKNSKEPPIDIAKDLKVVYLISGSARKFGDSIKLSIELFNPHSKKIIWNETYNELMQNAPSIQLSIAKQVAKSLNIKLTVEEEKSLEKLNTTSGQAFDLFLRAKAEFLNLTPEGFSKSIELLEKTIELDPNYSQGHTFLAWAIDFQSGAWLGGNRSSEEALNLVTPYIEKSIELNPKSSDAYLVKGHIELFIKGMLRDAKKYVEYALALNSWPRTPTNYCICTVVSTYVALGELEKAKEIANLGREVDPGNVFIYWDRANIHLMEGEIEKAQALYEEALHVLDHPFFQFFVGWSYYHDNQYNKAIKYFDKIFESNKSSYHMNLAYLSNSHFMLGNMAESEQYRQELEKRLASGTHQVNLAMAMVTMAQSNIDETLTWLEKSHEKSEYALAYMMNVDPIFKPLYEEPRFVEMRRKMQFYK